MPPQVDVASEYRQVARDRGEPVRAALPLALDPSLARRLLSLPAVVVEDFRSLDATAFSSLGYSSLLGQCLRLLSHAIGVLPHLRLRPFNRRSSLPSLCYRIAGNSVAAL